MLKKYNCILGIGDFVHDNGVSIVREGKLVFAVNEERVSRKKLDQNIDRCLMGIEALSGIKLSEIDAVAVAGVHPLRYLFITLNEFFYEMFMRGSVPDGMLIRCGKCVVKFLYVHKVRVILKKLGLHKKPLYFVNHHLTHAAGAYYASGYDEATVITTDGFGDGLCATVYEAKDNKLKKLSGIPGLQSPGLFYTAVTSYLGFKPLQHEGKITGLAAFGKNDECYEKVKKLIGFNKQKGSFEIDLKYFRSTGSDVGIADLIKLFAVFALNLVTLKSAETPRAITDYLDKKRNMWHSPAMGRLLNGYSREDVAWAFQKRLEEIMVDFARYAVEKTGIRSVAASGGTFANVKVNQRIGEDESVSKLFIYPHMGDGGTAGGAALYVFHKLGGFKNKVKAFDDVYLGPGFNENDILEALNANKGQLRWEKTDNVPATVAKLIADKKIVGRYAGRMEYGPRALGNRSILVHPSDRSSNDWLNKRLKRTEFMPFAPSSMAEHSEKSYIIKDGIKVPANFMAITYNCTQFMKDKCAAAVHIDGTARPQLVSRELNSSYYEILSEFNKLTGIPSFVNTSFNMHEEPIVCSPADAVRAFLDGAVDVLSMENYLVYPA